MMHKDPLCMEKERSKDGKVTGERGQKERKIHDKGEAGFYFLHRDESNKKIGVHKEKVIALYSQVYVAE